MAIAPAVFVLPSPATHDPHDCSLRDSTGAYQDRLPPSQDHWFGTDFQGCDYYARVIYGTRASMVVAVVAVMAAGAIALLLGGVAGYAGGWADGVISRVTDVFFGIPALVGAILFLSVVAGDERGLFDVALVLGLLGWPLATRLFRASVQRVSGAAYVEAARTMGASGPFIVARHVLPNAISPLLVYGTIAVGAAIAAEAGLSFLGVGLQEPTISWGRMIADAQQRIAEIPYLLFFPSLFLSVAVLAFLVIGDALGDAVDPRHR